MKALSASATSRLFQKTAIWAALAGVAYLAFTISVGWDDVARAAGRVGVAGIMLALALSLTGYFLRFLRWQLYLRALGSDVPNGASALIYLSGFAFTATPGRAGELLRGVFLQKRGTSFVQSTAAFISERLSDLGALLVIALPGLLLFSANIAAAALLCATVGVFALVVGRRLAPALAVRFAPKGSRLHGLLQGGAGLFAEWKRCHTPRGLVFQASGLSLLAWMTEALSFALILHLLGLHVALPNAIFIYAASLIAGALSFLPGGLGGTEATMLGLLTASGVSPSEAVAATLLMRLTTLWFAVGLGALLAVGGRKVLLAPGHLA